MVMNRETKQATKLHASVVVPQKLDIIRVTASSNHPGPYGCENVLNGRMGQDGGSDWSTTGEGVGAWIQLDLADTTMVTNLKFAGRVRDDKFKTVRLSFSDGPCQELEFPDNIHLNSFDLSPVNTTFVRITCLTCHNTKCINRGAQAIELWGIKEVVGQGMQTISVPDEVVSVEENEEIPVITFRLGSDDGNDDDFCVMIDDELNKNSMMETVMQSQDVCNELGIETPSEWKFMVKRKTDSFISLRWQQFRSMKVHQLTRLQNVDKNYLVVVKEKKSPSKVAANRDPIVDMLTAVEQPVSGIDLAHARGVASQSTDYGHGMIASQAIRGNLHSPQGFGGAGSYAHTGGGIPAWWRVDFNKPVTVACLRVYGRPGYGHRLQNVTVRLINEKNEVAQELLVENRGCCETFAVRFPTPVARVNQCVLSKPFPRLGGDDDTLNLNAVQIYDKM